MTMNLITTHYGVDSLPSVLRQALDEQIVYIPSGDAIPYKRECIH